jgi:hypothetical protein
MSLQERVRLTALMVHNSTVFTREIVEADF